MPEFTKRAKEIFAPFDSAGARRSVDNGETQIWGTEVERGMEGAAAGRVDASSWSDLSAITGDRPGQPAIVYGPDAGTHTDPVTGQSVSNEGMYAWSDSPAGWRRVADVQSELVHADNVGQGSANAIQATVVGSFNREPYRSLITLNFTEENTGAVTVSINGESPRQLVTNTGDPVPSGYLQAGMSALVQIDEDGNYRLFSYGDADAVLQAALQAVQDAQDAANEAALYDPTFRFKTVQDLLASTRAPGGVGTQWQAGSFLYDEAAASATDHHVETAGGVKLYALPLGDRMYAAAFGISGGGVDQTALLQKFFAAGKGYSIRLGRAQRYLTTEELVVPDDTSLNFRGSTIEFACVGPKRNLALDGNNIDVRGGAVKNIVGTPGQQGTYQTPIVIKRYDYLAGARNVTVENMTIETVTPMGVGVAVFGDTSGVTLRNLHFPDSAFMGTPISVHWSFNGDWQTVPPKTTVHQRNLVVENIDIGEMTYDPGTPVNFNISGVYLSAAYNARISNINIKSILHGSAVSVYAGDWGFQHAGEMEKLFGSSGVEIHNVRGTACRGLSVSMRNTLDPPLIPWPMAVEVSNMHVKGIPSNPESRGIELQAAQNVFVRGSTFDSFDVGVGVGGDLRNVILDDVTVRRSNRWGLNTNAAAALGDGLIIRNSRFTDNNQSETAGVADMTLQRLKDIVLDGNKFNSPKCAYNIRALNTASKLKVRNNHSDGASTLCYSFGASGDFGIVDEYVNNTASVSPSAGVRGGQQTLPVYKITRAAGGGAANTMYAGPGIPTVGTYVAGDRITIDGATSGQACEAICTVGGSPGTWQVTKQSGPLGGIGVTPQFYGQTAIFGGNAYMATGVTSSADWKQITN